MITRVIFITVGAVMDPSTVNDFLTLAAEGERAGVVLAELVLPWTEAFAELGWSDDAVQSAPLGVWQSSHNGPYAFVDIFAARGATLHWPMPICPGCAHQPSAWLQKKVRRELRGLMPDVAIEFVMDAEVR